VVIGERRGGSSVRGEAKEALPSSSSSSSSSAAASISRFEDEDRYAEDEDDYDVSTLLPILGCDCKKLQSHSIQKSVFRIQELPTNTL
jgi:hypothetical protein